MPLLQSATTDQTSTEYSATEEKNNINVKKSLSLFNTLRGLTRKSPKDITRGSVRSFSQEKDSPGIGKVVSYIFKRTNSMTSANRKKAKSRLVSKLSWRRRDKAEEPTVYSPKTLLRKCSLKDILDSEIYLPLFHGFLKSEFSEENLDFLMLVKEYRHQPSQKRADEIYDGFVRINSPKEINIEFGVRKKIELEKEMSGVQVFDEAYERVFKLLESDSFTRFKQSMFEV